jgi:branched-chain amino acid transport system substrate-binding protein
MRGIAAAMAAMLFAAMTGTAPARAAETVKVGLVLPYTGAMAATGLAIDNGLKLYEMLHGSIVAGKQLIVIRRDSTGIAPDRAAELSRELVTRERVDVLAGYAVTPNALAAAPIATAARKPMIVLGAAGAGVTARSPYIARVSFTWPQLSESLARWAVRNGLRRAAVMVGDAAGARDAGQAFARAFANHGGTVAGVVRVPDGRADLGGFVEKVRALQPQALFVFAPPDTAAPRSLSAVAAADLTRSGMTVLVPGDGEALRAAGNGTVDVVTACVYSPTLQSPANLAYIKAFATAYGPVFKPGFPSVAGFDGAALTYRVIVALKGTIDGDRAMAVIRGAKLNSPRGPITIDPATRDIIETVYIRRLTTIDGKPAMIDLDRFPNVPAPAR